MAVNLKYNVEGGNFTSAGKASSEVKKILKGLDIDAKKIKRIVVALYEAEVNVVAHAFGGTISITISADKIISELLDTGPGIENIELAMKEGFSTASKKVREMGFGAGMGLSNIKKNTDELHISSDPGKWTKVVLTNFF